MSSDLCVAYHRSTESAIISHQRSGPARICQSRHVSFKRQPSHKCAEVITAAHSFVVISGFSKWRRNAPSFAPCCLQPPKRKWRHNNGGPEIESRLLVKRADREKRNATAQILEQMVDDQIAGKSVKSMPMERCVHANCLLVSAQINSLSLWCRGARDTGSGH